LNPIRNPDKQNLKIVLILPSFLPGGLEKVITELSWFFSRQEGVKIYLICLTKGSFFYPPPPDIEIFMPSIGSASIVRPLFLIRLMLWLRKKIRDIAPDVLLSFGGKYNAFVLLSVRGLPVRTFISDRSYPSIS